MGAIEARRVDPPAPAPRPGSVRDAMRPAVDTPGEWWLVATYDRPRTPVDVAYQFRHRRYSRKPPVEGRWEYKAGPLDKPTREGHVAGLWVRYLGPE